MEYYNSEFSVTKIDHKYIYPQKIKFQPTNERTHKYSMNYSMYYLPQSPVFMQCKTNAVSFYPPTSA